jgi:hypothetical protein
MNTFTKLNRALSQVRPLWFLLAYLTAIPAYGLIYFVAAPEGFHEQHLRQEIEGNADALKIERMLEAALRRSIDEHSGEEFIVAGRKLDLMALRESLGVDDIRVIDGGLLSFRVRFRAIGVYDFEGERQLGWSFAVSVPEQPNSALLGQSTVAVYRFPEASFWRRATPFREQDEALFKLAFSQRNYGFGLSAPALTLGYQEDLELRRYLEAARGDPRAHCCGAWRMVLLSAGVITTLGLPDVAPISSTARSLVATEAVLGVVLAALFLNAIGYRVSHRRD